MVRSNHSGSNEEVILKVSCRCNNLTGDLLVTNHGVSFEKTSGFLGSGRTRIHHFSFDDLENVRIESKGIIGSIGGGVSLAIDHRSQAWGNRINRYHMGKRQAEQVISAINQMRVYLDAPEQLENAVLMMVKPEGEADIKIISGRPLIREKVAHLKGKNTSELYDSDVYPIVRRVVAKLIADGKLDGIITEEGKYVSSAMVTRKTVQYQVVLDFATLLSQLENKGIILQSLDCPSCSGKLEYPKDGSSFNCKYCGATVKAIDVFEKFKALLM
ncbi:MAG: hypothetical protein ACFFCX_14250 [Candidatus Sifarchaeia archaeon]